MQQAEIFLAKVESFLRRNRMHPTTFGKQAMNDGSFVFDLREGRSVTLNTQDIVEGFIEDADAASPEDKVA